MKNFSREFRVALAGPPRITQTEFSQHTGLSQAKVCRILGDRYPCDRPTLDVIVTGFADAETRRRLVDAYIRDVVSPASLSYLGGNNSEESLAALKLPRLSRPGRAAIEALVRSDNLADFEKIAIDLARAFHLELRSARPAAS